MTTFLVVALVVSVAPVLVARRRRQVLDDSEEHIAWAQALNGDVQHRRHRREHRNRLALRPSRVARRASTGTP